MSDLIRREDALKALLKVPCKIDSDNYAWIRLSDAFGTVDENVPSAEPERKKGKWIDEPYKKWNAHLIRHCSNCGWSIHKSHLRQSDYHWNFCPHCGAKMRGNNENS